MLYEYLTSRVQSSAFALGAGNFPVEVDPQSAVTPCGFFPDESLVPQDSRSFWGYSLLLEYFAYPEKFLFVDLNGITPAVTGDAQADRFTYSVSFDADFPDDNPFTKDNFRLFCSPAANIFKKDTEPLLYSGLEMEYRVSADAANPGSVFAHSIISVVGIDRATGVRSVYEPLYSFGIGKKNKNHTYAPNTGAWRTNSGICTCPSAETCFSTGATRHPRKSGKRTAPLRRGAPTAFCRARKSGKTGSTSPASISPTS